VTPAPDVRSGWPEQRWDAMPNRVAEAQDAANAVLAGADEIPNVLSDDNPNVWKSGRATRNRVATNLELRNSVVRLIAIVIAGAPKHYDASMVADDIIDRLDLNGCDIVNRRST
jgi:hypothetical protein